MTSFVLKIIACITMVCDHIRYVIPELNIPIIQILGRFSYPLFAFLLTEGYTHTKDLKKYYLRIILFAIISQIPFMLFRTLVGNWKMLNIMFTLLLGLIAITIYDKVKIDFIATIIPIIIILLGKRLKVDYGWWGVSIVFAFYVFRKNKSLSTFAYLFLTFMYYYLKYGSKIFTNALSMRYFIATEIVIIFILLYNGKQGKKIKYFSYVFYPAHMIIFYLMSKFLI